MTVDKDKLRKLALNGNGTASPHVPLLCSELLALLDELAASEESVSLLEKLHREACDDVRRRAHTETELRAQIGAMQSVCEAAITWKRVADDPGAPVWKYTEKLDEAIDALVALRKVGTHD